MDESEGAQPDRRSGEQRAGRSRASTAPADLGRAARQPISGEHRTRGLKVVLDREDVRRTLVRIAHEIVEHGDEKIAMVGIHSRGAILAVRLRHLVAELVGEPVPLGDLDISFYRDDVGIRGPDYQPVVHSSHIDFPLEGTTVVLVDDVLYTGRTVRAAIDALFDYGRPRRVQLAVLADRGHRELPIRPDYVGKNLPTARDERVNVSLAELDGMDAVAIAVAFGASPSPPESSA